MTGFDATMQALTLLNYTAADGGTDSRQNAAFTRRALPILHTLLADILPLSGGSYTPLGSLAEDLPVSDELALRLVVPGMAMHFAAGEGDGDSLNRFALEYTTRRSAVSRPARRIRDVMPR